MTFFQKYKRFLPIASFPIILIFLRIVNSQNFNFYFLFWNLILASLPLYFSHRLESSDNKNNAQKYFWAILWLLFFPNAAYIVTDLFHLHHRKPVPLWFDLLLLFSTALNGLAAGFLSLLEIEKWMHKTFKKWAIQPSLILLLFLCGFGIYLGRFMRWNSWDILIHPFRLIRNISAHVLYPMVHLQSWVLSILFGSWMYLVYVSVKKCNKI